MRAIMSSALLLLLVGASQCRFVQRTYRDVQQEAAVAVPVILSEPIAAELRKDQIPVTVIELQPEAPKPAAPEPVLDELPAPVVPDVIPTQAEILKSAIDTTDIAEVVAEALEVTQNLRIVDTVADAERNEEVQPLQATEIQPATIAVEQTDKKLNTAEIVEPVVPVVPFVFEALQPAADENIQQVKKLPVEELEQNAETETGPAAATADEPIDSNVRQATAATPTGSTTQQNFVQQLIQNSPIGQFISQFTNQQQQQAAAGQVAADEPATPAPTIPGFLNPAAAITSAQQAVQNAAQSVVNTTTQAFQGIQQFASNLGNQFQSTLSNLGGQQQQQQLTTSDSTTTRPPGPIQAIVNNFVGANNNQAATAATPVQQPGPLQGIISFFQGGNRPQGSGPVATQPAAVTPAKDEANNAAAGEVIDNKVDVQQDGNEQSEDAAAQEIQVRNSQETTNEIHSSAEGVEESLENVRPEELIVVHDESEQ